MSTYTIKYGDTLSQLAEANNTDVNTLMSLNPYITNANKIYAGRTLELPDAEPVNTEPIVQETPVITTPTKTTQQLAQEYATAQTANTNNDTNALLAQYEKIAEQQKQSLQQQKQLSNNQINSQKDEVSQTYHDNARQAYINSMLGKKTVQQQLSQAGLNTNGVVGSAYANLENAYGNNLATLQKSRDASINSINKQLNESNLQYAIKESELLADIENAKLELQKYGNELAYQKYRDAVNNYMTFTNYDYQKERDTISDQQWQKELEYQRERDAIADQQWQQEYELSKRKASSSSSSKSSNTGSYRIIGDDNSTSNFSKYENMVNTITGDLNGQYKDYSDDFKNQVKDKIKSKIEEAYTNNEISEDEGFTLFERLGV